MTTLTASWTPESVSARIRELTPKERKRLAFHWRRVEGGGAAMNAAVVVARQNDRIDTLTQLRKAAMAVGEKAGEVGDRAAWDDLCAGQCVAETMLAVGIADLAPEKIPQRRLDLLMRPWLAVVGEAQ